MGILLDKEREVPGSCHENVSCLLCGEERENAGNHSLPFSDTHDLYKVVITWPAKRMPSSVNKGNTENPRKSLRNMPRVLSPRSSSQNDNQYFHGLSELVGNAKPPIIHS